MNTNSSFNLLNIIPAIPLPSQPPHPSIIGNETQPQQQNQLLSTIQATQRLSQPQTGTQLLNKIKYEIKSEQKPNPLRITATNTNNNNNNLLFNGLLNAQQAMFQLPSNNNNNIHTNHNNTNHTQNQLAECRSVRDCQSIKRIVKLGVFHLKYGSQNTNIIAQFMNNCAEFNTLNADYQHSIVHHLSMAHKQEIAAMSSQYEKIYDFLHNFQQNNPASVQQLLFYNETMDTIYAGMDIKSEKANKIKFELLDLISEDKHNIIDAHPINPISMQFPSIIPVPLNNNIQSFPNLFSLTNKFSNTNTANMTMPTLPSLIPSSHIPLIRSVIQPINVNPINTHFIAMNPQFIANRVSAANACTPKKDVIQSAKELFAVRNVNGESVAHRKSTVVGKKVQKQRYVKQQRKEQDAVTRKFKCDFCGKEYKHLCNLKSHQKIHTDEALICPHCKKRFGRKANYKEHLRIHTGETPYQCQFCQRRFKHHHSWKDHIRIHTGEKPYSCAICKKRFKVGHNLTVHLRIHTGEKPYHCTVCFKRFRQKSALNSHLKRVHN